MGYTITIPPLDNCVPQSKYLKFNLEPYLRYFLFVRVIWIGGAFIYQHTPVWISKKHSNVRS